ncbi:hypothetical protein F5B21DRAFT_286679 [Xylaria acuta]|nr:hypothetical protein F5B21DRAFT_286679 [Xylaria acuta]
MANLSPPPLEADVVPALESSHHIFTPTEEQSPTLNTASTHDCEAQAIAILRSIQHGEMYEGATSCSINPILYAALNFRPRFDRVLATNKATLNGCARLMKFSCALCPHKILLHVSILSKVLFWYRVAATEKKDYIRQERDLMPILQTSPQKTRQLLINSVSARREYRSESSTSMPKTNITCAVCSYFAICARPKM